MDEEGYVDEEWLNELDEKRYRRQLFRDHEGGKDDAVSTTSRLFFIERCLICDDRLGNRLLCNVVKWWLVTLLKIVLNELFTEGIPQAPMYVAYIYIYIYISIYI